MSHRGEGGGSGLLPASALGPSTFWLKEVPAGTHSSPEASAPDTIATMAPRPRPSAKPKPTKKAKAAALALAVKNTRRDVRRLACKSLNELARKLHVSESNLVDAKNAVATDVEDLVKLLEKRVQTEADVASLRSAVESYVANGGVFSSPFLDPDEVLPLRLSRSTPAKCWQESREAYGRRLKRCCEEVNKECDVESLCKGLRKRMKLLQDRDGDR